MFDKIKISFLFFFIFQIAFCANSFNGKITKNADCRINSFNCIKDTSVFFNSFKSVKTIFDKYDTTFQKPIWILKSVLQDNFRLAISPLKIKKRDFFLWVPVIIATGISIKYDEDIYSNIKHFENKNPFIKKISPIITTGGDKTAAVICSSIYIGGLIFKNHKAKQTAALAAQAMLSGGLIVTIGKVITSRQRPSVDNGKDHWHWFPSYFNIIKGESPSKYDAFPSGHTMTAWTLATVIAKQYSEYKIIPIFAYTFATAVGLSRITEDAHWLSDVILSSALGYCVGNYIYKTRNQTKWTILPSCSKKNILLTINYKI